MFKSEILFLKCSKTIKKCVIIDHELDFILNISVKISYFSEFKITNVLGIL